MNLCLHNKRAGFAYCINMIKQEMNELIWILFIRIMHLYGNFAEEIIYSFI